jgi:hypothetical protein
MGAHEDVAAILLFVLLKAAPVSVVSLSSPTVAIGSPLT